MDPRKVELESGKWLHQSPVFLYRMPLNTCRKTLVTGNYYNTLLVVLFLFSNVVEYYSDVYNESEQELLITVLDLEVHGESRIQISS